MQLRFIFFCLIGSVLTSCIKQETGAFQQEYTSMPLELPAGASPLATHQYMIPILSSWTLFLQEHHLQQKDIIKVKPRSIILTPVFDNTISYDIISDAEVAIYDNSISAFIPIGTVYDPAGDPNELIFLPGEYDVKDIVSQGQFILRLKLRLRATTVTLSEHRLTVQFNVN